MRLYKFNSAKHSLHDIYNRRLKISKIDGLNDPFDCKPARNPDRRLNCILDLHWNTLAESMGIMCFSKDWRQPLMWGHYADSHKGTCLGFDVTGSEDLIEVDYSSRDRCEVGDDVLQELAIHWSAQEHEKRSGSYALDNVSREFIDRGKTIRETFYERSRPVFRSKHPDWGYEKEMRLAIDIRKIEVDQDGHRFQPWEDELVLREVILGVNCDLTASDLAQHFPFDTDASIFKAKLHASMFQLTRDEIAGQRHP